MSYSLLTLNKYKENSYNFKLFVRREDLVDPLVPGNKLRKLKYNLLAAKSQQTTTLLTYGGAFSNHIAATAATAKRDGFKSIGVIRGEELGRDLRHTLDTNPTLAFAAAQGMQLHFVSRPEYRDKGRESFHFGKLSTTRESLKERFGDFYEIPEGGTNALAVRGCAEMITEADRDFDIICTCVGTGGTLAGLAEGAFSHQKIWGFPALRGNFLHGEIKKWTKKTNWELYEEYHFGGYGKVTPELIQFMNGFYREHHILLDPIYTAKMFYGLFDLAKRGEIPENTRILAIHTGGQQAIAGMNKKLQKRGWSSIDT